VTGFLFHPRKEGILYARTDIGGCYRFDREEQRWKSLISHVTMEDLSQTYPISMALDPCDENKLYIACGIGKPESKGELAVSCDRGETFQVLPMPVYIHGNLNGRGTGERLIVDKDDPSRLFFASQMEGLWTSPDQGRHWEKMDSLQEQYCAFICQVGCAMVVSTAGVSTRKTDDMRGHSLYVSYDAGKSFQPLQQPVSVEVPYCKLNGLVAQRCTADDRYFYVTFSANGARSYVKENGYSCDSGDAADGHIVRYPLLEDGTLGTMEDITPGAASLVKGKGQEEIYRGDHLPYGFSGIAASRNTPGMLAASTIVKDDGDSIFLSLDYGRNWQQVLYNLEEGDIRFRARYMRPECNDGGSLIHWLSDLKLNPFDDNEIWFNTGTGTFRSYHFTHREDRYFTDFSDGIEETVHLNVYSLPGGKTQVIDIVGDLGGFAFENVDTQCDNSFADENNNRYITCINADFCDCNPERIIVTARGNWRGKTRGGLILSEDAGRTFRRLKMPYGLSHDIDNALSEIERPNVNAGWVAMSPDGKNIVWSIAKRIRLPGRQIVVSHDGGESFSICRVFDNQGHQILDESIKTFSDRIDSSIFYAFGEHSAFFVSRDGGSTFHQRELPAQFPDADFGLIDCANKTEVRAEAGHSGVFYIAVGEKGLWKLICTREDEVFVMRLSAEGDQVYRVGLGLGKPGGDYFSQQKALYVNGKIDGEYGFYRSLDDGRSFDRINTQKQMFGEIISIDGDCRTFGRFFLATGSCGLLYGEPEK